MIRLMYLWVIALTLLVGCTSPTDQRRFVGAGNDLYTKDMVRSTKNLESYFDLLCVQAGFGKVNNDSEFGYDCRTTEATIGYDRLTQAGLNDIDLRCSKYLGWVDQQRLQRLTHSRGLTTGSTFLTATLTTAKAGLDAFAILASVFALANSAHDAANVSLLSTIESSTIHTIVGQRRRAAREIIANSAIKTRSATVYALRNYLSICTPQSIVLTVNEYSRAALTGAKIDVDEQAKQQFVGLKQLTARDPGTIAGIVKPLNPDNCKNCSLWGLDPKNYSDVSVGKLETALCVPKGSVENQAQARAILLQAEGLAPLVISGSKDAANALSENQKKAVVKDAGLTSEEFGVYQTIGCTEATNGNFANIFESGLYSRWGNADTRYRVLMRDLNKVGKASVPVNQKNKFTEDVRALISNVAVEFDNQPKSQNGQVSPAFRAELVNRASEM